MKNCIPIVLVSVLFITSTRASSEATTNSELLAKVQQGDANAILEAGKTGDRSFVAVLEAMARPHFTAHIDPERVKGIEPEIVERIKKSQAHPVYDEPVARNSRMALARLGVKEYLDEILLEATNPTNSPVYKELEEYPAYFAVRGEKLWVQMEAFKKIAYINDRSTVKVLGTLLKKENPNDYIVGGDVIFHPPSQMAMETLAQLVDNPPTIPFPSSYEDRLAAWQQWWDQNKDKYP
jgi:hypothetical protein